MRCFNPRTHTGCDLAAGDTSLYELRFNPRTHTGCDGFVQVNLSLAFVSIHAPTRGATVLLPLIRLLLSVSIHAPTRGATSPGKQSWRKHGSFNPRTHTGCDASANTSIRRVQSFNPRTHTGCDFHNAASFQVNAVFQSTHPHGVRRGCWRYIAI